MTTERFDPDRLVEQACEKAGSDDFGEPEGWRDGLDRLCDGLVSEARLQRPWASRSPWGTSCGR